MFWRVYKPRLKIWLEVAFETNARRLSSYAMKKENVFQLKLMINYPSKLLILAMIVIRKENHLPKASVCYHTFADLAFENCVHFFHQKATHLAWAAAEQLRCLKTIQNLVFNLSFTYGKFFGETKMIVWTRRMQFGQTCQTIFFQKFEKFYIETVYSKTLLPKNFLCTHSVQFFIRVEKFPSGFVLKKNWISLERTNLFTKLVEVGSSLYNLCQMKFSRDRLSQLNREFWQETRKF